VNGRLTERWAHFASEIRYEGLPSEAVRTVKGLILDTLGTALAGSALGDCAGAVAQFAGAHGGAPEATMLGHGRRVSVLTAAFANGAFAHALNFDALGPWGGHVGLAAVPAPVVMSERRGGVSGKELLTAVAVAAEFCGRLAGSLERAGVDANEKFLEGQLLGYFGAVAGAGRVMNFTPGQMHDAIGLALMQAAGSRQPSFEGSAAKAIYGGYANQGAVMSVLLAEQNIDAKCAALEGPAGIFGLFFGGRFDEATLSGGLGEDFHAFDIRFKAWPTSDRLRPFIEAAIELRREHRLQTSDISAIHLQVSPRSRAWLEPRHERTSPKSAATAANSMYFGVAKGLANGKLTLADLTPDGIAQPEVKALAAITDYTLDDDLTTDEGVVGVRFHNGSELTARSDGRSPGMSFDALATKFFDCARFAASPVSLEAQTELVERIDRLEDAADTSVLTDLLNGVRV
jgi:2-methylcitrate dehydratase PrpD